MRRRQVIVWLGSSLGSLYNGACRRQASATAGAGQDLPPKRLVTLTPSLDEIVWALGAGDRVVGVSDYCDYPPEACSRPPVGTFLQPSIEKILALRPALILVDGAQREVAVALQQAGAQVLALPMNDLADVRAAFLHVGAALGDRQAEVRRRLALLDAELAAIRRRVQGQRRKRVLFVVDRQPGGLRGLVVAGPGTYLDELLQLAGGSNVLSDLKVRYAKIAVETIEARQPEVILDAVHSDVASLAQLVADWQALKGVEAVANKQVYVLTGREFVTPGPRLGQALRRLVALLYPDEPAPPDAAPP